MPDQKRNTVNPKVLIPGAILAATGLALSGYALWHHLLVKTNGSTDAFCNVNAVFNCDDVALSSFSEIQGIPLGVFGIAYFLSSLVLLFFGRKTDAKGLDHRCGYIALTLVGGATSIALGVLSMTVLGKACLVCLGIYGVTALQIVQVWLSSREFAVKPFSAKLAAKGLGTAIMTTALTVFAYNLTSSHDGLSPSKTAPRKVELASATSEITINLSPYSGLGEDYRKGPDDAKVTIVEFADYQCPGCKHASETLHTLSQEFQGKVRVVFKNYPLDGSCNKSMQGKFHEHSCKAAIMSRCAGEQGKFWQYHDLAFKNQASINEANLKAWAAEVGISPEQITHCLTSKDILAKVQDDIEQGNKVGVDSTPTLFINGKKVMGGRSIEDLRLTITELLR